MSHTISPLILSPERGTRLFVTSDESVTLQMVFDYSPTPGESFPWNRVLFLLNKKIDWILTSHPDIETQNEVSIEIPPSTPFMLMNLTQVPITITGNEKFSELYTLFNPYLYEHQTHENFDPQSFIDRFQIPPGYTDTLAKWYSVKYSYEKHNLILIRPGTGLSFQTHSKRAERWEIIHGNPIIISGTDVSYANPPKTKQKLALGALHSIINSSTTDWVVFKETYKGTFDEEDIVRVFNPNHYFSPSQ